MKGNIEIKIRGAGDCAGQGAEITAEIAIVSGFARADNDSVSVNTVIGGSFKGKTDLVRAYGEATARAVFSIAGDSPDICKEFAEAYHAEERRLTEKKIEEIRKKIIAKSPFSEETTEAFLKKIEEAAGIMAKAEAEGGGACTETN